MGNALYVDDKGNSVHSCEIEKGIPNKNDIITINGTRYKVEETEMVITKGNVSHKVTLKEHSPSV